MAPERWVSKSLVKLLIDMKNYTSAAEVISGSEDMLNGYSRLLGDFIAKAQEMPKAVDFKDLKQIIDTAHEELAAHQKWQAETIENLPIGDDEVGLTGPVHKAFNTAAIARNNLLQELMRVHDKYLKAQVGRFDLND